MTANGPEPAGQRNCPQCGAALPAGTPPELCPKCLLRAGLGAPLGPQGTVRIPPPLPPQDLLSPGQTFGQYRIVRALGGGGMGTVFEAEDLESGRRVALKVLSHALDSPEARQRFFREGRLAASINHPNSVYVFGTEEIGGTPAISMELVSGGTLADRISTRGPMPWAEAVDAVLQIIAGLEAAERIGILHRDVKPSNCFVDPEGLTKIGDFGLSISTAIRTEPSLTTAGAFLGTPAFCSPEQLRGEELSLRADIYSVGATLFYLLTGRTPFEAKNMVALLATVLEHPAPSPRQFVPDIPHGLARVVRRCLEKNPSERFRTYDELRQALSIYSSAAPAPAGLGFRFLAGVTDMVVLNLAIMAFTISVFGDPMQMLDQLSQGSRAGIGVMLCSLVLMLIYYGLFEGLRGATPGKALCHLRVVGKSRNAPGVFVAVVRALIYVVLPMLPFWLIYGPDMRSYFNSSSTANVLVGSSFYLVLALLFSTARRRNGFAALHDLVTGTRVIMRTTLQQRPAVAAVETAAPEVQGAQKIGPYHVLEALPGNEWRLGYDLRLLRKVWLRLVPPGTPPVPGPLRNLGRPARLRWLAGRRGTEENWDAYEAPAGQALLALATQPQPWHMVRYWLHDLAVEISAATNDRTLPELALDRVWITAEGRAKLLDFPVPGSVPAGLPAPLDGTRFLDAVAAAVLSGEPVPVPVKSAADVARPLPLHARDFLKQLLHTTDAGILAGTLKPWLQRPTEVSRLRRAAVIAGCLALTVPVLFGVVFGSMLMQHWQRSHPGLLQLNNVLHAHWALKKFGGAGPRPDDRQFAIFIASKFRSTITNASTWQNPLALTLIKGEARQFAEQSVREYPSVTPEQLAPAERELKKFVPEQSMMDLSKTPGVPLMVAHMAVAIYVGIPALLAALLFRGGLILRLTGIVFVRRDGRRASRLRVFWRVLV
ncbi:MAG TPA: protein kinase, partial [Clostridia bacterium]|nr:protein kinase [Clostridia bacterium]